MRWRSNIRTDIPITWSASTKAPGIFYAIVLETEDTSYLIKVDVKVDDQVEEDDKDFFGDDEIKDDDEIIDTDMADMDDEE